MGDTYSKAATQYGDSKGTISVDWHNMALGLSDWYERFGGPDTHMPIAMSIRCAPRNHVSVSILAVEKNADMKEFEHVPQYLAEAGERNNIPVKKVTGEVPLVEVFETMKRCHILLFDRGFHDLGLTLECVEE